MLLQTFPYFIFDGNAAEAMGFYADVFDAKVMNVMRFSDMPEDPDHPDQTVPEEAKALIMNGTIQLPNGVNLMFSDNYPGMPFTIGNQITTMVSFDDPEHTRRVFNRLKEDGTVAMELQITFWSPLYGNVTDKFGNQWQVDTEALM